MISSIIWYVQKASTIFSIASLFFWEDRLYPVMHMSTSFALTVMPQLSSRYRMIATAKIMLYSSIQIILLIKMEIPLLLLTFATIENVGTFICTSIMLTQSVYRWIRPIAYECKHIC